MTAPNLTTGTFLGVAGTEYDLDVSSQYKTNVITFLPASNSGVCTIYARLQGNTGFEAVENGTVDFSKELTKAIRGYQLTEFRFVNNQSVAYTVKIKQTDADTER